MKKIILICIVLFWVPLMVSAQVRVLTGTVTSSKDGSSLPGVSVLNKTAGGGVATDMDGKYSIKVNKGDLLIFSFVGMKSKSIEVQGQTKLDVALDNDSEVLDELVVIGYGQRRKGTIAGSVSTVGKDVIDARPVVSFDQALQGQVSGVQITTSSGEPSASSSVRIRGVSSISAGTAPLYIMDGVMITEGDFNGLNPSDIENVSVLKDASSTSIYGSRAANGVIVITTKRGKYASKAKVSLRAQYGKSYMMDNKYDMMDSAGQLELEEYIGVRAGGSNTVKELLKTNVDWKDLLYHSGTTQNYEMSVAGGGENVSYYTSFGYFSQDGITLRSGIDRYSARANIEARANTWLKIGTNVSLSYSESETTESGGSTQNPALAAMVTKPYYNPYTANGKLVEYWETPNNANPLDGITKHPQGGSSFKMVGSLFLELKPIENLTIKTLGGIDASDIRSSSKSLPSYFMNNNGGIINGSASEMFARTYRLTMTNTANYMFKLDDLHNFIVLAGQEAVKLKENSFGARTEGLTDDRLSFIGAGTIPKKPSGGFSSGYSYMSFFGRVEYNYDYKYYVDLSLRGDGSSRFGKNNRWARFWSIGSMWDAKKEVFLADNAWLTMAQLSASIGTSGNSEIGAYKNRSWVSTGPIYNGVGGMTVDTSDPGNPDLTWESMFSTNVSLKLGFLERYTLKAEYYNKLTSDMLMDVPISQVTGYSMGMKNVGKMRNSGFEFEVGGDVLSRNGFTWNLNINASYNRNKIVELYDGAESYVENGAGTKLQEGESYGAFFLTRFAGVNPANGDGLWYDKNGQVTNVYSDENAVLLGKSYYAPWSGGMNTVFSYKGVSLSAYFSWMKDRYLINNERFMIENPGGEYVARFNQSVKLKDIWRNPGDITEIPRKDVEAQLDDRWLEDASYFKLKNVTVSWDVPKNWLAYTRIIGNVRVYAQGQNLFTLTKFTGFDPEVDSNMSIGRYPSSRQFIFGLDLTF
ncbi:MAG: TonB-dependent receptor [Odoribacter sp.]